MSLVYGRDTELCDWTSLQLFGQPGKWDDKAKAIGVESNGKLIACVVYSDYHVHSIEMTIASLDKRWCTRHTLQAFFAYPFAQLKLGRVQAITAASNEGAISMLKRLGFTQEGFHRKACAGGVDAISFGMLAEECGWLKDASTFGQSGLIL